MTDAFKRILALARRTGDRLIVTDPDGAEAFVLLNLDQYEELLGGPKDEPPLPPPPPPASPVSPEPPSEALNVVPEPEGMSEEKPTSVATVEIPPKEPIPPKPTVSAEPEEFGEEQFYLEPIE